MKRIKYFAAPREMLILYAFRDVATGADRAEYFMAPNPLGKPFRFKPNLFYSKLGKVFPLAGFQAKLFLTQN